MFYELNLVYVGFALAKEHYTRRIAALYTTMVVYSAFAFSIHGHKVFFYKNIYPWMPLNKVYIILYTPATRQELYS